MRHLYESGSPVVLCGAAAWRTGAGRHGKAPVHVSKARRSDCPECRSIYRARLRHRRAGSLRAAARSTEFEDVARRLSAEAARLEAL
jgi:hypothetical protein